MAFRSSRYRQTNSKRSRFRRLFCDPLEKRLLLAADWHNDWHNENMPADVNGDGIVTRTDAVAIVDHLTGRLDPALQSPARSSDPPPIDVDGESIAAADRLTNFLDVSNDGAVTSLDSLMVINFLALSQTISVGSQEGLGSGSVDLPAVVVPNSVTGFADWWFDLDSDPDVEADRSFGLSGDFANDTVFLAADWNDDGNDEMVVVRKDYAAGKWQWFVETNEEPFYFGLLENPATGQPADIPVAGDWDGANGANAGVARANGGFLDWYITTNDDEVAEIGPVLFGLEGDIPVTGDWNMDGREKIGTARRGDGLLEWYLDVNGNGGFETTGEGPFEFGFSSTTDTPVVGDWDNNGMDDLGVARRTPLGQILWFRNTDRENPFAHLPAYQYGVTSHTTLAAGRWGDKQEVNVREPSGTAFPSGRQLQLGETGREPAMKTLVIENTGNQPLTLTPGAVPNGFLVTDFPPGPLAAGELASFQIAIDPAVDGFQQNEFTFSTNDENESTYVIRILELSPQIHVPGVSDDATIELPSALVDEPLQRTFVVENVGKPDLLIENLVVDGPITVLPGAFPATIAGDGEIAFTVVFDTSSVGSKVGTISFNTNDPASDPFNFTLTSNVGLPEPNIEGSIDHQGTLNLGPMNPISVLLETSILRIDNIGTAPLVLDSASLSSDDFSLLDGFLPQTIPANRFTSLTIAIEETPGDKQALLTLNSNDPDRPAYEINLIGRFEANAPLEPRISVDQAPHDGSLAFPRIAENQPAVKPFVIRNRGNSPLQIQSATATLSFSLPTSINPSFPLEIPANESREIFVEMDNTASPMTKTGQLILNSNASPSPYRINLTGIVDGSPVTVDETFLFSLASPTVLHNTRDNGVVEADESDIIEVVLFSDRTYSFSKALAGGEVGLTTNDENIDAFAFYGGQFYLSTEGSATAGSTQTNEITFGSSDIVRYNPINGLWSEVYKAEAPVSGNNIDGIDVIGAGRFLVSLAESGDIPTANGPLTVSQKAILTLYNQTNKFDVRLRGGDISSGRNTNVDAVSSSGAGLLLSVDKFGVAFSPSESGNDLAANPEDAVELRAGQWRSVFDGSNFGIAANIDAFQTVSRFARSESPFGDYSDAPSPYPITSHLRQPGSPYFGSTVDFEPAAQPEDKAEGDDRNVFFLGEPFPVGDEDGIGIPQLVAGQFMEMSVQIGGAAGIVDGWIDFNGDGDWDDDGEHIVDSRSLPIGISTVSFVVPADAGPRDTFARFRIADSAMPDATTEVVGGEVEDYRVEFLQSEFLVTNTFDIGPGSLRQAIVDANSATVPALIRFKIPATDTGFVDSDATLPGGDAEPDLFRISPLTALPMVNNTNGQAVSIDGTTQTLFGGDTNAFGPEIEISGLSAGNGSHGVEIISDFAIVNGLVVNDFEGAGVVIRGDDATLLGSYVGTDPSGTMPKPNRGVAGVFIVDADGVTVGGRQDADRNVVSGNERHGVVVDLGQRVNLQGNHIGTSAGGTQAVPNGEFGLEIVRSSDVNVGGDRSAGEGNLISGNESHGLVVAFGSSHIHVAGNFVGVDSTGIAELGNGTRGVSINDSNQIQIGGRKDFGLGNVISANGSHGVHADGGSSLLAISGNNIGTDVSGSIGLGNGNRGVTITDVTEVLVGGPTQADGNVISGNMSNAIGNAFSQLISDVLITSNFLGLDASGTSAIPNGSPTGDSQAIRISNAFNVTIGAPGAGNVISGNAGSFARGIGMSNTTNLMIQANRIGTNADGTAIIGNGHDGIRVNQSSSVMIGGSGPAEGNLISGNSQTGLSIDRSNSVEVSGNQIGTDVTGSLDFGNQFDGISVNGTLNLDIGGDTADHRNLISGNERYGINFFGFSHNDEFNSGITVAGNFIGTAVGGNNALGNSRDGIRMSRTYDSLVDRNVISGNGFESNGNPNGGNGLLLEDGRLDTTAVRWSNADGGNGHYYLVAPPMLWSAAEATAVSLDGHLASVTSQQELDFIQSTFRSPDSIHRNEDLYIGLNDRAFESTFEWTTGESYSPTGFAPWAPNEPQANGDIDDAVLLKTDGSWDNVRDDFVMFSLFEFESNPNLQPGFLTLGETDYRITGNSIGLGFDQATPLGNGGAGVAVQRSENLFATSNLLAFNTASGITFHDAFGSFVGAPLPIEHNIIRNNGRNAVQMTGESNEIIVDGNRIFNNASLGIDLGDDGITPNDPSDIDNGPNGLQNSPTIDQVIGLGTDAMISGTLDSTPETLFDVRVYANDVATSEDAEGEIYLGSAFAQTDEMGLAKFSLTVPGMVASDDFLTATATAALTLGGTSEFSMGVKVDQVFAPSVASVVVNEGAESRSQLSSVEIVFDTLVEHTALANAFTVRNTTNNMIVTSLIASTPIDQDGRTAVRLTFGDGPSVDSRVGLGNSLSDGNYMLGIDSSSILSTSGAQLMREDYFLGAQATDRFFRLYGDSDGDRDVDGQDYGRFGLTFLKSDVDASFNSDFDSDGDGDVDGQDYGRFGLRFLSSLSTP